MQCLHLKAGVSRMCFCALPETIYSFIVTFYTEMNFYLLLKRSEIEKVIIQNILSFVFPMVFL